MNDLKVLYGSLKISTGERAREDAVRSCVDATEALIKELGKATEIGEAT